MGFGKDILVGILGVAALATIGTVAFIGSGIYDIGADDHHTVLVRTMIQELRERSISARTGSIDVPPLEDPSKISTGAARYSTLCVGCHLAPGVTRSDLRRGLYPHPPNLAQEDIRDSRRAFWTIKHGIKMSAMPAWGNTLDDRAIWEIVSFVRQMPTMTPDTYQQLLMSHPSEAATSHSTACEHRLPEKSPAPLSSLEATGPCGATTPETARPSAGDRKRGE